MKRRQQKVSPRTTIRKLAKRVAQLDDELMTVRELRRCDELAAKKALADAQAKYERMEPQRKTAQLRALEALSTVAESISKLSMSMMGQL